MEEHKPEGKREKGRPKNARKLERAEARGLLPKPLPPKDQDLEDLLEQREAFWWKRGELGPLDAGLRRRIA